MAVLPAAWCNWLKHIFRTQGAQLIKLLEPQVRGWGRLGQGQPPVILNIFAINYFITLIYVEEILSNPVKKYFFAQCTFTALLAGLGTILLLLAEALG